MFVQPLQSLKQGPLQLRFRKTAVWARDVGPQGACSVLDGRLPKRRPRLLGTEARSGSQQMLVRSGVWASTRPRPAGRFGLVRIRRVGRGVRACKTGKVTAGPGSLLL